MPYDVGVLDIVGLVLYLWATIGYHTVYIYYTQKNPLDTVKGKIHLYRRTWVKRILDKDNQMLAVQTVRNLLMTSSFMASSALLVLAVILNVLIQGPPEEFHVENPSLLRPQLIVLAAIFAFSFFMLLLSVRYLNLFTILIGADPDLMDHVEEVDAVTYLSNVMNRASNRFTYGQRGFYFSLPIIGWIMHPLFFVIVTAAILSYLMFHLDFKRWKPPKYMQKPSPEELGG